MDGRTDGQTCLSTDRQVVPGGGDKGLSTVSLPAALEEVKGMRVMNSCFFAQHCWKPIIMVLGTNRFLQVSSGCCEGEDCACMDVQCKQ